MPSANALTRANELDRKLAHVLDRGMRRVLVREALLGGEPDDVCGWAGHVLDRTPDVRATPDPLREAIVEVLTGSTLAVGSGDLEPIPYTTRRQLYEAAVSIGAERLASLLRSHPDAAEPTLGPPSLPREMEEIPLGVRRSLAKGDDRVLLEKLALDPDPVVIGNLLRNPRLREVEVVRIAALRTVPTSTLEAIARVERWATRLLVRTALARNPNCPVALAIRLIGGLPLATLKTIRSDPGLPDETMRQLEIEMDRRSATPIAASDRS